MNVIKKEEKKIENLINIIDPEKSKCPRCKKWKNKEEVESKTHKGFKYICVKCWKKLATKNPKIRSKLYAMHKIDKLINMGKNK